MYFDGVVSTVLANIYLHYVIDLWFDKQVKPIPQGRAMLIRYADDFVVAFQYQQDAMRFYQELPQTAEQVWPIGSVAEDKTRLTRVKPAQSAQKL